MTAREAPSVPPSTVSLRRLRRALVRKICSFSSLTFFSSERRRTVYPPSVLVPEEGATVAEGAGLSEGAAEVVADAAPAGRAAVELAATCASTGAPRAMSRAQAPTRRKRGEEKKAEERAGRLERRSNLMSFGSVSW